MNSGDVGGGLVDKLVVDEGDPLHDGPFRIHRDDETRIAKIGKKEDR